MNRPCTCGVNRRGPVCATCRIWHAYALAVRMMLRGGRHGLR